jgi:hypothetical protein
MRKYLLAGFVVSVLFGAGVVAAIPSASAKVRLDDGGQLPFYARIEHNEIFHDDEWAIIVFYRSPDCIPADFNLLDQFHFPSGTDNGAFDCQPPTVEGFALWENGPTIDPAPTQVQLKGTGAVPVWFVSWGDLQGAIIDNVLTIGELSGMGSLLKGTATSYSETIHPFQSNKNGMVNFTGKGTLEESSTPFLVHALLKFPKNYDPTTGPLPPESLKAIQIRLE